jgi:hypothetical protein
VLSADVRFEGFTTSDWTRVLSLFRPRRRSSEQREPTRPRGGVVAVHSRGTLLKLVHTEVGRLRLDDAQKAFHIEASAEAYHEDGGRAPKPPSRAEALARNYHASWCAIIEAGTLESIMERFAERSRRGDDIAAQALNIAHICREEALAGRVEIWPGRLRGVPIPSPSMVSGSIDSVCPPGRTMVLGLFEDGELWTSIALRRGLGGFNLVLGPDEVRTDMGLLAGDWRRDYRHLSRVIEERCGPLAFGCYAEVATLRKLEVDPTPGAWARAAALRDLILSPLPAPLAIPLGIDAGWAAWTALRTVAERLDPVGVVAPAMAAFRELLDGGGPRPPPNPPGREGHDGGPGDEGLGFHPLELLRRVLSRES